jgi:hypothetical protein
MELVTHLRVGLLHDHVHRICSRGQTHVSEQKSSTSETCASSGNAIPRTTARG